jgi:hypothetical protein
MRPFYDARVGDLSIEDRVRIECQCRRIVLIPVQGLGLPGHARIRELGRLLRCDNCGERGKVELTIVWRDG